MRGPHDVGGLPAGPIKTDDPALTFWEKQVDGLRAAVGAKGLMSSHESRRAVEALGEDAHASMKYYERWTAALCRNMIDKGVLTQDEIDARVALVRQRLQETGELESGDAEMPGGGAGAPA